MAYWLVIGTRENLEYGLEHGNTWGFAPFYESHWSKMSKGDVLFLYAMRPVKGLIGFGKLISKTKSEQPFFPDEIKQHRSLWPLRIVFSTDHIVKAERWGLPEYQLERRGIVFQRALQPLTEERDRELLKSFEGESAN